VSSLPPSADAPGLPLTRPSDSTSSDWALDGSPAAAPVPAGRPGSPGRAPRTGPVRGPGQPRCHHQLAHAQPVQAPGQLSDAVPASPRSDRRPPGPASGPAARTPNTGAAPAACAHAGRQHTPARRLPGTHNGPAQAGATPGTGRRRPGSRANKISGPPARDLADAADPGARRPRPILRDPARKAQNQNGLMRTARRLSPEHTGYRVAPARQHTGSHRAVCHALWPALVAARRTISALLICSPARSAAVALDDAPKEQSVAPNRTLGLSSFLAGFLAVGPQTVTCPPNRVDDGLTELAAQVPHVNVDEVRPRIEVHAPGHGQ